MYQPDMLATGQRHPALCPQLCLHTSCILFCPSSTFFCSFRCFIIHQYFLYPFGSVVLFIFTFLTFSLPLSAFLFSFRCSLLPLTSPHPFFLPTDGTSRFLYSSPHEFGGSHADDISVLRLSGPLTTVHLRWSGQSFCSNDLQVFPFFFLPSLLVCLPVFLTNHLVLSFSMSSHIIL